jgi:hypothetical protein
VIVSREPLDLGRPRALGDLIADTVRVVMRHLAVFLAVTLVVVAPVVLLVDGIWGRELADGVEADPPVAARIGSVFLGSVVIPPLVTALNVVVVLALSRGAEPTVADALRAASGRFPAATGTVLLATLGIALGLLLLIVPGVWLAVRWYFGAQVAVVDRRPPTAALRGSAELVRARWWRILGYLLAGGLVFGIGVGIPGAVVGLIADAIGGGALYVACRIIVQAVGLSLTAVFATLLFFDLRARRALPWVGTAPVDPVAPERPAGV